MLQPQQLQKLRLYLQVHLPVLARRLRLRQWMLWFQERLRPAAQAWYRPQKSVAQAPIQVQGPARARTRADARVQVQVQAQVQRDFPRSLLVQQQGLRPVFLVPQPGS